MKKAWIILIALALLAFSMPIFADAPAAGSFHAWNQGNFYPVFAWGSNGAATGWGPTWDAVKGIDQEWTFSYDGNNYGFNATFEFGGDNFGNTGATATQAGISYVSAAPSISWFATYYKFGDLVKVTIGKPRFSDYTDFTVIEGQNFKRFGDSDFMGILQVFPTTGLTVAAALYVPDNPAYSNAASNIGADYMDNFGVAASYAIPNLASVKVLYRMSEGTAGNSGSTTRLASGSVNISAVKGLVAEAGAQVDTSNPSSTYLTAWASAGLTMFAPLTINADLALKNTPASSTASTGTAYFAEVQAEYVVMAPWSIGAQVGYDGGSATTVKFGWYGGGSGEWTGLQIWPYVKAAFDNGSSLKVGVVYATADSAGNSNAVIAVPIIYVWAF
jgi:hypothetical protein